MNNRNRNIGIAIGILAAYAVVIVLLLVSESGAEDSSIHSVGDAIWYSIITLTTVGYGDMAPVTAAGRVLGIVLALCSLGLLTALIGILMSFISGEAMPRFKLRSARAKKWYVFSEENEQSEALAESAMTEDPDAIAIFCKSGEKLADGKNVIRLDCSFEDLMSIKGDTRDIVYFCIGKDSWENYRLASEAAKTGMATHCLTEFEADDITGSLHTFSEQEIISRCYWREFPLQCKEKLVVLIGSGSIAAELLENGLLTNVFEPGRYISYHVFGDSAGFRKSHPEIIKALSGSKDDDSLLLHDESWEEHPDLIRSADRIIICEDDDKNCLSIYNEISKWFPTAAAIHVRLSADYEQVTGFGSCSKTFTLKSIIRDDINILAVTLNDIYCKNANIPSEWNDLSDFKKRSNIAAADHMIVKIRFLLGDDTITELTEENCQKAYQLFLDADPERRDICRNMEHRRWMRFYQMYNWVFASKRDDLMRKHPLLLPYSELSEEEKEKDAYAWEMLGRVAERETVR